MTDQNVVRLVADLQRKISQLDMQISLMKPIAQQVADIVGQTRTDSDVNRSVTINTKNRTSVIDRQKTISKDTDLKSPKAEDSKLLNQDDWLKSFAFNYVPQPDGPAKPDEKIVPVTDERDKIFEEAEQKEKGISIWRTKTSFKKDKGLLSESRKLLSAFSDSSKKLDILSPPVPKLRPENGPPKKNPIETLKRQETQRLSVTSQSSDESDSSAAYNPSQTISLDETMLRKEYDSLARTASKNYTSMKGRRGSQRVTKRMIVHQMIVARNRTVKEF
ncbi:hypothetical protein BCR33DRAFT_15795 [Rhizoclosmatium globosum]|uniref:Uncharacterized protein n=1 Tax=Rhizoclosmatium globosum TaxID=329046 RepID=A0A1Y2CRL1_9FUNG|nr:hypothetical protein BCR33DRAFT_15795 [Rhizoclosmatium globosum]|eukprot:ORY48995.1 hypothetical protein BCR33DRAFT_15795 [Rhizoclosmatium globosum]